jgi:hypothetical protein
MIVPEPDSSWVFLTKAASLICVESKSAGGLLRTITGDRENLNGEADAVDHRRQSFGHRAMPVRKAS